MAVISADHTGKEVERKDGKKAPGSAGTAKKDA